jgi:hypothetical protein
MIESVTPLPLELEQRFDGMRLANESLMLSQHYEEARKGFHQMYDILLQKQPAGVRYHKGYPLHQIGMTFLLEGKSPDALRYFILAHIEDLLLQKEGEEDKADKMPAGKNLRGVYKVPESALRQLKEIARNKKKTGELVQDPNVIFDELARGRSAPEVAKPTETPDVSEERRKPGKFESDWKRRVFVGGSYMKHYSEINQIKKVCKGLGYDPVIAFEFEMPPGKIHHHALMLLHECSKAIFEVTEHVGQLMEIERLRDYQVEALIVCQVNAPLSEMLEALLESEHYEVKRYSRPDELEKLVRGFLSQTTAPNDIYPTGAR